MSRKKDSPGNRPDIIGSTHDYEHRLAKLIPLIPADLRLKHEAMAGDAFRFLRATFYHWSLRFPTVCPELMEAPVVLAVGDIHVENFGTWRDAEGRLVWGVNDFDEAFPCPTGRTLSGWRQASRLVPEAPEPTLSGNEIATAILAGYRRHLEKGGVPFVLEENNARLRRAAYGEEREPARFWEKFTVLKSLRSVPAEEKRLLLAALPHAAEAVRIVHRRAGLGSLGRPRFTALAELGGAFVAREIKPLAPSAWAWAVGAKHDALRYAEILKTAVRIPDPFLTVRDDRVLRRISPHCSRIELADLHGSDDKEKLLEAMGRELANIHLGTPGAPVRILRDLDSRDPKWLASASKRMAEITLTDQGAWKNRWA